MSNFDKALAYTDAEVASLLRVSKRTVYRLRKSGALPAVRIGRAVRIPAEGLTLFLQSRQEHNTSTLAFGTQEREEAATVRR